MHKLALGTVQFGMNYGISNDSGQVCWTEAKKIVEFGRQNDIKILDTAISYGSSEEVLGRIGVSNFNIITKLPALPKGCDDVCLWLENQVLDSLKRLHVSSLYAILLHRSQDLTGPYGRNLINGLNRIRASNLVQNIGVSIYDPSELRYIVDLIQVDLVQAPLNLLDRRLETSGWLSRLHSEGIEVHTRSTFLQGLLLMQRQQIPSKFQPWESLWDSWSIRLKEANVSALMACLSYPLSLPQVKHIVVGVQGLEQLQAILEASKLNVHQQFDFSFMAVDDPMLINPSNWSFL